MLIHKNKTATFTVSEIAKDGSGIAYYNNKKVFISDTIPGEIVLAKIIKITKTFIVAIPITILSSHTQRQVPTCPIASKCGGCQWQHISYPHQASLKEKTIHHLFQSNQKHIHPIIKATQKLKYRNKAQFALKEEDTQIIMGLYAKHSHHVIATENCPIQHDNTNHLLKELQALINNYPSIDIYNENHHDGDLRHLVIRSSFSTDETMLVLVSKTGDILKQTNFIEALKKIPQITSCYVNINTQKTDTILGLNSQYLFGKPYIEDSICDIKLHISLDSFVQPNPVQASLLYQKALSILNPKKTETGLDLYCGLGAITLLAAKKCHHITGIEVVPEAIKMANKNKQLNSISNCDFICSDTNNLSSFPKTDFIILDPPRKGCDPKTLDFLNKTSAKKMLYISCNPITLKHDCTALEKIWKITHIQPVDMFPQTTHIEVIILLEKIKNS